MIIYKGGVDSGMRRISVFVASGDVLNLLETEFGVKQLFGFVLFPDISS